MKIRRRVNVRNQKAVTNASETHFQHSQQKATGEGRRNLNAINKLAVLRKQFAKLLVWYA